MFLGFPRKGFVNKLTPTRKIANVGVVADSDVNRFVIAAGITNHTEQSALYALVFRLKNAGLWTKIRALYPMVGSSAVSCSFNLRNPSLYQITWINAPTFSATGVIGNGSNQCGLTGFTPSILFAINNCALGTYVRNSGSGINIGCLTSGPSGFFISPQPTGNAQISFANAGFTGSSSNLGFFFATKTSDNRVRSFHNGDFKIQSGVSAGAPAGNPVAILAQNSFGAANPTNHSNQECALAIICDAMSDTEAALLYSCIQEFQTILGRQV